MWIKAHTWKNNKSKFLQTVSDSKSAWAASTFSSDSFIFLHEENRKNRPLPWFLLPSHWAKVKLIFISTSNSFWGLKCHTRETGHGEKGGLLCCWFTLTITNFRRLFNKLYEVWNHFPSGFDIFSTAPSPADTQPLKFRSICVYPSLKNSPLLKESLS